MASPNNPISSAELIRRYSKAKVVEQKRQAVGDALIMRPLTNADVRESLVRKYC
jgi:hypothetical protein